jgi:DNA-binding transcriptional MerR regulator
MDKLITLGEASELLGVSKTSLRRWEKSGKLVPERLLEIKEDTGFR